MIVREGELEFDFSSAMGCEKLDKQGQALPHGMSFVDFLIVESNRLLLVEVKDPSTDPRGNDPHALRDMEKRRISFVRELHDDTLIHQRLTPKARNSYLYLHLMGLDEKPVYFVFLLGARRLEVPLAEGGLVDSFRTRLLKRLRKEMDAPWVRHYVADCLVLTESTWEMAFPQYPLKRIS